MARYNDLSGQQFGKLTVIGDTGKRRYAKVLWLCKCSCGNYREVVGSFLTTGKVTECKACARSSHQANAANHNINHALRNVYYHMNDRCSNPECEVFKYYGGRGISVCNEWSDSFNSFREWAINNGYAHGLTLDRINVDGNYSPENCRWITIQEQSFNRRDNIYVYYRGKKFSLAWICYYLNIDLERIRKFLKTNLKYL